KHKFIKIENFLPKNYVKDGTVDYTNYLQKVLNESKNVVFPNFPIRINDTGLVINSGSIILFPVNSKLVLGSSSKSNYEILRIHNKNNITLVNPTIIGDRDNHKGSKGEWGMGISIKDSEGLNIINPKISNCWGDGIYIGKSNSISKN